MGILVEVARLPSRVQRLQSAASGVRIFNTSGGSQPGGIWDGLARIGNSIVSGVLSALVSGISISFSALWSAVVSATQFLWHFNWGSTDEQLDQSIKSAFNNLGPVLGGALGNAVGWLACGIVPTALIATFNEPLALHVLKNVGEEMVEELVGNLVVVIRQSFYAATQATFTYLYKNVRKLWRQPDTEFRKRLEGQGLTKEKIDKAVADRSKPWSFAQKTEDAVEAIPNQFLRGFIEEFLEESADACIEAGYVIASSIDSYLIAAQQAYNNTLGPDEIVEILFNRQSATPPSPNP